MFCLMDTKLIQADIIYGLQKGHLKGFLRL
jgi:hypothetical protein